MVIKYCLDSLLAGVSCVYSLGTAGAAALRMGSCGGGRGGWGVVQLYPPPTVNIIKVIVRASQNKTSLSLEIIYLNTLVLG